jgi:hypothetical protein
MLVLAGDLYGLGSAPEELIQSLELMKVDEGIAFEDLQDLLFGLGDIPAVFPLIPEDREGKGGDQVFLGPDGTYFELKFKGFPAGEHQGKGEEQSGNEQDAHRQRSRYLQELQEPVQAGP